MRPACRRTAIGVWSVPCGTRNDEPSAMLGNVYCGARRDVGSMVLWNVLTLTLEAVQARRREDARPGAEHAVVVVLAALPLAAPTQSRDRAVVAPVSSTRFTRVANVTCRSWPGPPVRAKLPEQVVSGAGAKERSMLSVAVLRGAHEHGAVLVAVLDRAEPEQAVLCSSGPPIEPATCWRSKGTSVPALVVVGGRQRLPATVAAEEGGRAVHRVGAGLGHDVDDRASGPARAPRRSGWWRSGTPGPRPA